MLNFLIKSSVALFVLHMLYEWVIKSKTTFAKSRYYLVTAPLIALLASIIQLPGTAASELANGYTIPEITVGKAEVSINQIHHMTISNIIIAIIILGTFLVLLRVIYKFIVLYFLFSKGRKQSLGKYRLVFFKNNLSPFTFFKTLFFPDENGKPIDEVLLKHELAHARGKHTLDNLLMELASLVWWFHPSYWAMRKALLLNHEYLADDEVLKNGYNISDYQQLLLAYSLHTQSTLLGSSFNQSELLNRMKMMLIDKNKLKNNKRIWISSILTVALLSSALVYNSCESASKTKTEATENAEKAAIIIEKEEVFDVVDIMPTFQGSDLMGFRRWVMKAILYPDKAMKQGLEGKVFVSFVVQSDGSVGHVEVVRSVDPLLDEEAVRVIASSPKWDAGIKNDKAVATRFTMPITFTLAK